MINAHSEWNGDRAMRHIADLGWEGLVRATKFLLQLIQIALNKPARYGKGPHDFKGAGPGEPPRKRTGHGANSVTDDYDEATMTTRVGLQPGAIYMLFLELGSKAVEILPKNKPFLVFWVNGVKVFAKRVLKPAQAPRPWLLVTTKRFLPELAAQAGSVAEKD
jgi:hypothetical protein